MIEKIVRGMSKHNAQNYPTNKIYIAVHKKIKLEGEAQLTQLFSKKEKKCIICLTK